jgi:hypothetical protein
VAEDPRLNFAQRTEEGEAERGRTDFNRINMIERIGWEEFEKTFYSY